MSLIVFKTTFAWWQINSIWALIWFFFWRCRWKYDRNSIRTWSLLYFFYMCLMLFFDRRDLRFSMLLSRVILVAAIVIVFTFFFVRMDVNYWQNLIVEFIIIPKVCWILGNAQHLNLVLYFIFDGCSQFWLTSCRQLLYFNWTRHSYSSRILTFLKIVLQLLSDGYLYVINSILLSDRNNVVQRHK